MAQLIALLILIILGKWIWDTYGANKAHVKKRKPKTGEVIDISDAWIDMNNMPYKKRDYLLNGRELAFYQQITDILAGSHYCVLPKTRLVDLLTLAADAPNRQEYYLRAKERNVDLVICELPDLNPVLVILYDGKPEGKKKQLADRFTKKVCEAAELPYVTFNPSEMPKNSEILKILESKGIILSIQ
ncbi:MAG: DUF2726 domain-containing protein [Syntrophomonadaceae bacterium]|jgi:hypothetical protein